MSPSAVQRFYDGTTVFLTGATGFLGSLVLEKLLRACRPERIYILVRPKKDKDEKERLEEIFKSAIFDVLKEKGQEFKNKVTMVKGDCLQANMGLSRDDWEMLVNSVNVIIHCAATVRFNHELSSAIKINVRSTVDVMQMAKQAVNLKAMTYVSTAYSFCIRNEINEKDYETPIKAQQLLKTLEVMGDDMMNSLTPSILGEWPNTYSFTKAVAEHFVYTEGQGLPVSILRPSIVGTTVNEPIPGYTNNLYGPTGIWAGIAVGLIRTLHLNIDVVIDVVAADHVCNAIICSAWASRLSRVQHFHITTSYQNPTNWRQHIQLSFQENEKTPTIKQLWYPSLTTTTCPYYYSILRLTHHMLPAYIFDFVAVCIGKPPQLVEAYRKLDNMLETLHYFMIKEWTFTNHKTQELIDRMSEKDRKLFNFDVATLDWDQGVIDYVRGTRVHILKDPLETVPAALRRHKIHKLLHTILMAIFAVILYCIVKIVLKIF